MKNFLISKNRRQIIPIICTFFFLNLFSAVTPAAGTGTGTGTDKKPFNFVGAYLTTSNGNPSSTDTEITSAQVPLKPTIKLAFDKNVVYGDIWLNNQQSLNMFTSSGDQVPAKVFRISDQVNFEARQYIFITPLQDLNPGEGYRIVINPGLLAKSGATLGMSTNNQPVVIKFSTQSETTAKANETNLNANKNENAPGIPEQSKKQLSISYLILYITAGTFLLLGCFWVAGRWFSKRND
ncbi:MAG: Ig-like domain-containing protein [Syntrophomonas sp.]